MTDKVNLFDLKTQSKENLVKYLSFFKNKKEKFVKEVGYFIDDFQLSK